jgi:hypothetical protein
MKYIPWRVRRRRVLAATIAIQAVVVGGGALMLERRFFQVVGPLCVGASAVLAIALYRYAPDGDVRVIRAILGANLPGVASLVGGSEVGLQYGVAPQVREALAAATRQDRGALARVGAWYRANAVNERGPSERAQVFAEVVLMVVGAVVGGVAQRLLAPPGMAGPIWTWDLSRVTPRDWLAFAPALALAAVWVAMLVAGARTVRSRQRQLVGLAERNPRWLVSAWLPSTNEVRQKFRQEVEAAAALLAMDEREQAAYDRLRGVPPPTKWRQSALGDVQFMIWLFGTGIILGAVLPSLLGLH